MRHDLGYNETRKKDILTATFRCVSRQGIDGTTLRAIAEEAKMNPALLHYYFKDKENLLNEFVYHLFERLIDDVERQFRPSDPPEEKLETLFKAAIDFVRRQKRLFVVFVDVWSFCLRNPALQRTYANINNRMAEFLAKILDEGIKADVFHDVPKDLLAYHFFAFVVGIGIIWHMDNQSINLEDHFGMITRDFRGLILKQPARPGG